MRALLNQDFKVRLRVEDEGGILVDAAAPPSLTAVSSAGDPATVITPADHEATGLYAWEIPPLTTLDTYTLNFSWQVSGSSYTRAKTDKVKVVRDRVCPLWMYREDPELAEISTLKMLRLSDAVDEWLESALMFAPVETAFEEAFIVPRDTALLRVPDAKFVMTVTGVTCGEREFTQTEIDDLRVTQGRIERGHTGWGFLTGTSNAAAWQSGDRLLVRGTHGPRPDWTAGVPEDLQRVAVILARYANRQANYPERARQVVTDGAMITFSMPSPDKPTGLPEVDLAVTRYRVQGAV